MNHEAFVKVENDPSLVFASIEWLLCSQTKDNKKEQTWRKTQMFKAITTEGGKFDPDLVTVSSYAWVAPSTQANMACE